MCDGLTLSTSTKTMSGFDGAELAAAAKASAAAAARIALLFIRTSSLEQPQMHYFAHPAKAVEL